MTDFEWVKTTVQMWSRRLTDEANVTAERGVFINLVSESCVKIQGLNLLTGAFEDWQRHSRMFKISSTAIASSDANEQIQHSLNP